MPPLEFPLRAQEALALSDGCLLHRLVQTLNTTSIAQVLGTPTPGKTHGKDTRPSSERSLPQLYHPWDCAYKKRRSANWRITACAALGLWKFLSVAARGSLAAMEARNWSVIRAVVFEIPLRMDVVGKRPANLKDDDKRPNEKKFPKPADKRGTLRLNLMLLA
jgi:hypothetical protein